MLLEISIVYCNLLLLSFVAGMADSCFKNINEAEKEENMKTSVANAKNDQRLQLDKNNK